MVFKESLETGWVILRRAMNTKTGEGISLVEVPCPCGNCPPMYLVIETLFVTEYHGKVKDWEEFTSKEEAEDFYDFAFSLIPEGDCKNYTPSEATVSAETPSRAYH